MISLPALFWIALAAAAAVAAMALSVRYQRASAQRNAMRSFYKLSEEIIAASTPTEIAEKLAEVVPAITGAASVALHLYNRRTKSLERVPVPSHPEPAAVSADGPQEGLAAGLVKCFRERAPLHIADARQNPLVSSGWKAGEPRSVMFMPLLAQKDALGVIEAANRRRVGYFHGADQAMIEHLANQVAAALKLQEQKSVREHLFRSEKLAATGQLISAVAGDLRAPLDRIAELSRSLMVLHGGAGLARELGQLAAESRRACEIVSRLVSFARPQESGARLVDINAVAASMVQFREPEWKASDVRVQNRLSPEPALVLGVQGQIEEVLLNLLVSAEQAAAASGARFLSISSSRIGGRAVVEISRPDAGSREPAESNANLDVCRAIVQNHGGDLRVTRKRDAVVYEADFPLAPSSAPARAESGPAAARPLSRIWGRSGNCWGFWRRTGTA
jgi:K+-sensing histidine kinase KdpD